MILCQPNPHQNVNNSNQGNDRNSEDEAAGSNSPSPSRRAQFGGYHRIATKESVLLRGVPVRQVIWGYMRAETRQVLVRVFLDPGSEVTLVSPRVVQLLKLRKHQTMPMEISGPGSGPVSCNEKVTFELAAIDGSISTSLQAWPYTELATVKVPPPPQDLLYQLSQMGMELDEYMAVHAVPDLVIGVEHLEKKAFTAIEMRRITPSLVVYRLPFGWSVRGYYDGEVRGGFHPTSLQTAAISSTPGQNVSSSDAIKPILGAQEEDDQGPLASLQVDLRRTRLAEKGVLNMYDAAVRMKEVRRMNPDLEVNAPDPSKNIGVQWDPGEDLPKRRDKWPVGRIVQVQPGQDGIPRMATVKMANGARFCRAVQSLIPLEATSVGPPPPGEDVAAQT